LSHIGGPRKGAVFYVPAKFQPVDAAKTRKIDILEIYFAISMEFASIFQKKTQNMKSVKDVYIIKVLVSLKLLLNVWLMQY